MTGGRAPGATAPGRSRATRVVFFVAGATMASWAPLVPFAKARAEVDDGLLGLLLLCFGTGSLLTMPLAGHVVARFGARAVIATSAVIACTGLGLLTVATDPLALAAALLWFGAGLGALDVSMNLQAIAVERDAGRAMMSGFHAGFSLGGLGGALAMASMLSAGLPPHVAALATGAVLVVASLAACRFALDERASTAGPMFGIPRGIVLLIGALCFASFLVEGAVLDWSAVLLSSVRGVDRSRAGIGYAVFSAAMVVGRLAGDRVVERVGRRTTLTSGTALAACGIALVAAVDAWPVTVAGFAVIGIGCASLVPILFTAAGRQTAMPERLAVPAVTTLGYAGLLAGPAAIGFVAGRTSLSTAFALLCLLMAGAAILSRRMAA